jgi:hypothetical protein
MRNYKNIILLRDINDDRIDSIILTNEDEETIQQAIYSAKNEFYELEEQNNIPMGINCEFEYIYCYLCDKYDIEFIETWQGKEVYY